MTSKPPAPQAISALLRKAGFKRASPDRIITWGEVRAGDVVLQDDCLIVAERVQIHQSPWGDGTMFPQVDVFHRLDNGALVSNEHHGDRFTAVLGHRRADQVRADR